MKTLFKCIIGIFLITSSFGQTQWIKMDGEMCQFTGYMPNTINKEHL
ncbi:MAG: hypothetical protein ACJA1Z_002733 [Patiriisocius sp.]|jgi:hypothetical protein